MSVFCISLPKKSLHADHRNKNSQPKTCPLLVISIKIFFIPLKIFLTLQNEILIQNNQVEFT